MEQLKQSGVIPAAVTSDGAPGIRAALSWLYPEVPHQRCLVHLQRLAAAFLTQRPKTMAGVRLKQLVDRLSRVDSYADRCLWRRDFVHWCNRYFRLLKERSHAPNGHWWYTHRNLRKTRRLFIKALPDMWHFLDEPADPQRHQWTGRQVEQFETALPPAPGTVQKTADKLPKLVLGSRD